jgi:ABC-type antimicrobial peptide transport system permease subunit
MNSTVSPGDPPRRVRVSLRRLVGEVWLDVLSRLGRSMLTALGTAIGIAVLVATMGLARSAETQIVSRFDELAATQITVKPVDSGSGQFGQRLDAPGIPWDGPERVSRIDGVVAAALQSELESSPALTVSVGLDPTQNATDGVRVVAASPTLTRVTRGSVRGVFINDFHETRGEAVAVVGARVADRFGLRNVEYQPVINLGGMPVAVIGVFERTERETALLDSIIIPNSFARRYFGLLAPGQLLIETRVGAKQVVAEQVAIALRPDLPDRVEVLSPPEPALTRANISSDTRALFLALAGITLVVGGFGIANSTLVSVLERFSEIGLRRALGARRRDVFAQYLTESATLGFIGATTGCLGGLVLVILLALRQGWTPVVDPAVTLLAPVLGIALGFVSGLYPAWRAGKVEPIDALRTS